MRSGRQSCATAGQPGAEPGGWSEPPRRGRGYLPALWGPHSSRTAASPPTALSPACPRGLPRAVLAACPTCRGRVLGAGWYPWGCASWSRYRVRRGDRAIGQRATAWGRGPERGRWRAFGATQTAAPPGAAALQARGTGQAREEGIALSISPLGRPGNDLLSRVLRRSTIGAGAFHGRVRNGIGCSHPAIITRSAKG